MVRLSIAGALASAFAAYRVWQATVGVPGEWQDSADYHRIAATPGWFARDIWAGERPPLVPFLLKVVGNRADDYLLLQVLIGAACWLVLAWAFAQLVRPGWGRIAIEVAVLGTGLSRPIVQWDRQVLGETTSIAAAVLFLAALMYFARRGSWLAAVGVLSSAVVFAAARDTHVMVVAACAGAATVVLAIRVWNDRPVRATLSALAAGLAVIAALGWAGITAAGRDGSAHMANIMATRIFPYPERLDWFAGHGMPQADEIRAVEPAFIEDIGILYLWIDPNAPDFPEYGAWLDGPAAGTYTQWLIQHPGYVFSEPLKSPERATNNAHGDLSFYASPDRDDIPALTEILFPSRAWLAAIGVAGASVIVAFRLGRRRPDLLVAVGMVPLGLAHMLASWHADGMETMRHALVGNIQIRLGVLALGIAGAAAAGSRIKRTRCTTSRTAR